MATNSRKTDKRATRAERRAAEEAAAKAAAEKAAKERRQQTIIGAIVVLIIAAIVATVGIVMVRKHQESTPAAQNIDEAYAAVQEASPKPSHADDKGGILVSADGYGKKVEGAPTVSIYMDFICPGCGNLNRKLDPTLVALMEARQLNIDLHFMSFMDSQSTDDYSSRAANAALQIAQNDDDPKHLLDFLSRMFDEDFQPEEGKTAYVPVSDEQIAEQAKAAGVSDEVAGKLVTRQWDTWLGAINSYTPLRSELWNQTGYFKGSMSTPTVQINGTFWDTNVLSTVDMTLPQGFLASIGLTEDQIGTDTMPSIGAEGKPLSLTGA